ncbi:hypothetical protein NITHO_4510001 [Nitrolancea hollandica Lb]|uniref:Uncharacterized protein n=1 Tax=Nitrolancea hollandica Lb TaxID=1129897 RepID=I4EKB2_9BACT|nr:hypothetical protein NITHO_4510001 [Nitrolancea hollandica Lb]
MTGVLDEDESLGPSAPVDDRLGETTILGIGAGHVKRFVDPAPDASISHLILPLLSSLRR